MATIVFRGRRDELIKRLKAIAPMLAGRIPDPTNNTKEILESIGLTLLGKVQEAYDTKSKGGTDEMGIKWNPLSAVTLLLRRKEAGAKVSARLQEYLPKLPQPQRRLFLEHQRRLYAAYTAGPGSFGAAARKHARYLLDVMRPYITPTRYHKLRKELENPLTESKARKLALAGAFALILRDTGIMFNTLSPQINSVNRILRIVPGSVTVGSNDPKLKYHQSSKPRRLKRDGTPKLPRRQILPDEHTPLPESWVQAIADTIGRALASDAFWRRFLGTAARSA